MDDDAVRNAVSCAALLMFGTVFSCTHNQVSTAIRCEGLIAVSGGASGDRVVVAFRNVSGRPIISFKARYEALEDGEPLAIIDFACDRRTVRKLELGDEIPFVFEPGELAYVNYVHFRRDKLPDRFFVSTAVEIQASIATGILVPGGDGEERCIVSDIEFETRDRAD
jgi:hypothetical protein